MSNLGEIRRAAVTLFAERGFAATGIRDVGRAAGLNSATLYHYASGKEELLAGIMRAGLEELLRTGREAVAYGADPAVQLARLVAAHVANEAVNPLTSRVTDTEVRALTGGNRAEIIALRDAYEALVAGVLERGAARGGVPASPTCGWPGSRWSRCATGSRSGTGPTAGCPCPSCRSVSSSWPAGWPARASCRGRSTDPASSRCGSAPTPRPRTRELNDR